MLQQDFETRLAELISEALDAQITRGEIITGLECARQCLLDEEASEALEGER